MSVNILCANGLLGGNMKHIKIIAIFVIIFVATFQTTNYAGLTEKQANDIALFAQKFIEKGNNRIDEKGYPLITYALTSVPVGSCIGTVFAILINLYRRDKK